MDKPISTQQSTPNLLANAGIVPVRREPAESAEMTNQLLYGDFATSTSEKNDWIEIISHTDNYPGWVSKKMVLPLMQDVFKSVNAAKKLVLSQAFNYIDTQTMGKIIVPAGSVLYCTQNSTNCINGNLCNPEYQLAEKDPVKRITSVGNSMLGAPYLWGGKTIFGIDCSGLVQVLFKIAGIELPRDASQQATHGTTLSFANEAKAGDLAFFDNEEGKITHVGIFTAPNELLHASGRVRKDSIDHQGIYNKEDGKYSHKLRLLKRIF